MLNKKAGSCLSDSVIYVILSVRFRAMESRLPRLRNTALFLK